MDEKTLDLEYKKLMDSLLRQQPRIETLMRVCGDVMINVYQQDEAQRPMVLQTMNDIIAHTIGFDDTYDPIYIQ